MATFPSLPLFTDALLGDTTHLSQAEFGAYMLMLIVAWRTPECSLPNDDNYLARITRSNAGRNWIKIKQAVMPFWTANVDGSTIAQKRLTKERLRLQEYRDHQSEAGKSSALKKKERLATAVDHRLQPDANQTSTTISIPNTNREKKDGGVYTPEFLEFWETYPKRDGDSKKEAFKAHAKAVKKTEAAIILSAAQRCRARLKRDGELKYAKGAAVWLNQECWETEPPRKAFSEGRGAYV